MPEISVIIPVYKVEAYLRRCLDSVYAQTFTDFEVICVNDGSPDGCGEILAEYAAKHSNIHIINQENQGLSMARNNGLKKVKGKYVCFLDSDDFLDNNFLLDLYNEALKTDADIVMTSTKYLGGKKFKKDKLKPAVLTSFAKKISVLPHGGCWDKLYKKAFLTAHQLRFPQGLYWEDNLFTVQACYFANKLAVINSDDSSYNYVSNSDGITKDASKHEKRKNDAATITEMIMDFVKTQNCSKEEIDAVIHFCLHTFINARDLHQNDFYYKILDNNKFLRQQCRKQSRKMIKRQIIAYAKKFPQILKPFIKIKETSLSKKIYFLGIPVYKIKYSTCCKHYLFGLQIYKKKELK